MTNVAVLMGRLTADPEIKTTQSGVSVTSFKIAVDRSYVKPGEERQADFITIVAWRKTADFIGSHFRKGQMISITGTIQTRNYEDKQGNKRTAFEVVANEASFCGGKNDAENTEKTQPKRLDMSASDVENDDDFEPILGDGDLPF